MDYNKDIILHVAGVLFHFFGFLNMLMLLLMDKNM